MTLKDLGLDQRAGIFDSDRDNLLESFYIPCLNQSVRYFRSAGYFCSNALALAVTGIEGLLRNNGTMRVIANVVLSEEDQADLRSALRSREASVIREISDLADELELFHISMLAYLLKTERLELKIAVVDNALEHSKWGIFQDSAGNTVVFNGSDNETVKGWLEHHERFEAHLSWLSDDMRRFVQPTLSDWERYWGPGGDRVKVYTISEAFEKELIRTAPKDDREFEALSSRVAKELRSRVQTRYESIRRTGPAAITEDKLRDYQKDAIDKWEKSGRKGILKMATGTGKTFVAVVALQRFLKVASSPQVVTVVAPTQLLVSQWRNELEKGGFESPVEVMGNRQVWIPKLKEALLKVELGRKRCAVAVATYASFCAEEFTRLLDGSGMALSLVADEVHHAWAPETRKGLLESYQTRMGLSATPELYMDESGTKELQQYFNGVCFEFGIDKAIPKYLTEYDYYVEIVHLESDELKEYERLSRMVAAAVSENGGMVDDKAFSLILRRAKIVRNARGKWPAFERILERIGRPERTLVYCSDKQIDRVKSILRERKIKAHQITHEESLQYRDEVISQFKEDRYQVIVAMKVLDEGMDLPGVRSAIILSSTGNSVEYVQRRGRVLRKAEGKDYSVIHDVLVLPWESKAINVDGSTLTALRREVARVKEFASTSRNPLETLRKIAPYEYLLER